jgi:hypothetical protein
MDCQSDRNESRVIAAVTRWKRLSEHAGNFVWSYVVLVMRNLVNSGVRNFLAGFVFCGHRFKIVTGTPEAPGDCRAVRRRSRSSNICG